MNRIQRYSEDPVEEEAYWSGFRAFDQDWKLTDNPFIKNKFDENAQYLAWRAGYFDHAWELELEKEIMAEEQLDHPDDTHFFLNRINK